jgi:hypothetical protein
VALRDSRIAVLFATALLSMSAVANAEEASLRLDLDHIAWPDDWLIAGGRIVVHGATFQLDDGQPTPAGSILGFYPGLGTFMAIVVNDPLRHTAEMTLGLFVAGAMPDKASQLLYLQTPMRLEFDPAAKQAYHGGRCTIVVDGELNLAPAASFLTALPQTTVRMPLGEQCIAIKPQ